MSRPLAVAISRPSALKLGVTAVAVAGQPFQDRAAARVDEREEAVVAADNEQPAARHVSHAADRPVGDHARTSSAP